MTDTYRWTGTQEFNFVAFQRPPAFPTYVHIINGVSVRLNADGTWEGDADAFCAALADVKQSADSSSAVILWLIANALRNQPQRSPAG